MENLKINHEETGRKEGREPSSDFSKEEKGKRRKKGETLGGKTQLYEDIGLRIIKEERGEMSLTTQYEQAGIREEGGR